MTLRQIADRTRTLFYILVLGLLCSSPVKATEQSSDDDNKDSSEDCGSLTLSDNDDGVTSSDNELRTLLTYQQRQLDKYEDEEEAKKVEKHLHLLFSKHISSKCWNCMCEDDPKELKQIKTFLLQLKHQGQHEKFCKALSVRNLNHVFEVGDHSLYDILTGYLKATNVRQQYKQQLITKIKASDIFLNTCCDSTMSIVRRWLWTPFALGTTASIIAPLAIPIIAHQMPPVWVWWGGLLCPLGWGASCAAFFSQENYRMRLVRVCMDSATTPSCHQKLATVDLGCMEE